MHSHQKSIEDALKETSSQLNRLHDDIHRALEKVTSRENYLNSHLDQPLANFRTTQGQLAEVKEQYRQASGGVTERTRALTEVCYCRRLTMTVIYKCNACFFLQQGTGRAAASAGPPHCTNCNSLPINSQCTNRDIAV